MHDINLTEFTRSANLLYVTSIIFFSISIRSQFLPETFQNIQLGKLRISVKSAPRQAAAKPGTAAFAARGFTASSLGKY